MNYIPRKRHSEQALNLTPLIDIVFLLLVFFMLTSHFINEKRLSIDLPSSKSSINEQDSVEFLSLDASGELYYQEQPCSTTQRDQLLAKLAADDQALVIRADRNTPFAAVIGLMDQARTQGIASVGFATAEQAAD